MANKNIMVCVTQQKHCDRLIKAGERLAHDSPGASLYILHVYRSGQKLFGYAHSAEALDYLYELSKAVGAEMTVQKSEDVAGTVTDFARQHDIGRIIMGASPGAKGENRIAQEVGRHLGNVSITIM